MDFIESVSPLLATTISGTPSPVTAGAGAVGAGMLALALDAAGSWPLTCALGFLVALALVAKLVKFWLSGSATGSASPGQASRSLEEVRAQQQQRLTEAAQQRAAAL